MPGHSSSSDRRITARLTSILLVVAADGGPIPVTEIARRTDVPTSTARRLTTLLTSWRLLNRSVDGRYTSGGPLKWATDGGPGRPGVLSQLTAVTGHRARLGVPHDTGVSYLERRPGTPEQTPFTAAGSDVAHLSALGHALLAFAAHAGVTPTPESWPLASRKEIGRTVAVTRLTGVAITRNAPGTGGWGVAVPVLSATGAAFAALQITVADVDERDLGPILAALRTVSTQLSGRIAGPG